MIYMCATFDTIIWIAAKIALDIIYYIILYYIISKGIFAAILCGNLDYSCGGQSPGGRGGDIPLVEQIYP